MGGRNCSAIARPVRGLGRHRLAGGLVPLQAMRRAGGQRLSSSAPNCNECGQAAGCRLPQVWQIDPNRCIACGRCQINCVLDLSAVKAVNCFAAVRLLRQLHGLLPHGRLCAEHGGGESALPDRGHPTQFIETQAGVPYFEYTIDEQLVYRLRQVRRRLPADEWLALLAGRARPLPELQRVFDCRRLSDLMPFAACRPVAALAATARPRPRRRPWQKSTQS